MECIFYLDNNISVFASEKEEKYEKLTKIIYPDGNTQNRKKMIITPFSLLEFSGAKINELFSEEFSLPNNPDFEKVISKAFDFYEKNIRADFKDYFLNCVEQRKPHKTTVLGKCLIDKYKAYINEERFKGEIIRAFAIDRVSNLPFSEILEDEIVKTFKMCGSDSLLCSEKKELPHKRLVRSALSVLNEHPETNMVRLVFRSFECIFKLEELKLKKLLDEDRSLYEQKKEIYEKNKELYEQLKFIKKKPNQDIVDTEMIHLSVFGREGKPVKIITAENDLRTLGRIKLYKDIIKIFSSNFHGVNLNFCDDFEIEILSLDKFESNCKITAQDISRIECKLT